MVEDEGRWKSFQLMTDILWWFLCFYLKCVSVSKETLNQSACRLSCGLFVIKHQLVSFYVI